MRFFFYNIILIFFLQSGLVRTCANEEKVILNEAKAVNLAKNLKVEVKVISNRVSLLKTIKKNASLKKTIYVFTEIIYIVVTNNLKKMLNDNELLVLLNGKKFNIIQYNSTQLNTIYFIFSDIYATKMLKDMKKSIGNSKQGLLVLKKIANERGVKI